MPTITVSIDGTTIGTSTLSDADFARVAKNSIKQRKGAIIATEAVAEVPAVMNDDGTVQTPAVSAQPATYRDPTPMEAINFRANDFFKQMIMDTMADEAAEAARDAAVAIKPIIPAA